MNSRPKLQRTRVVLNSPGGRPGPIGKSMTETTHKSSVYKFRIVVIDSKIKISLLARRVTEQMGLVDEVDVEKYYQIPKIGCITTARKVSFPTVNYVEKELNRM